MPIAKTKLKRRDFLLGRAEKMFHARQSYANAWPNYESIFKQIAEKRTGKDEWRATLPDTWAFATIKTAQSAFVDGKVIPTIIRHKDAPLSKAEDTRDLYSDVAEKGNLDQELYFARLDAFKLGMGHLKTIYFKKPRTVWEIQRYNPKDDTFKWKKKVINEFDDPKTVRVSPYLVLVDDLARFGEARDRFEIEVMGRDEAEAMYGHLVDFDKDIEGTTGLLKKVKAQSSTQIAETDGKGLRGTEFEGNQYHFFAPGFEWSDDYVEILHYWNQGIQTPSGAMDSYEILINGFPAKVDTKAEPQPIPYIHKRVPFTDIPYSPYSKDEFYAAGIIEIGLSEAEALKKFREMMSDRQKVSLFSPAFSDVNDEIDQKQLALRPLSIIRTKGGVPRQFQIPGITNSDLAIQERHEMAYKRAVGVDERILGIESSGQTLTATEVSFIRESALKRLREFSFLYRNALLHGEIKYKLSLFKQYYSSPLAREPKVKGDIGAKILKAKFKEFKVREGNTYVKKQITENFFEGEVDVDLDLQLLMPLTQAQLVTLWSQILRDSVPFVQAGIIDISLKKVFDRYVEALGANPADLVESRVSSSIRMAETEHQMYAKAETAKMMKELLPDGTPPEFVSEEHILKHSELSESDVEMGEREKILLLEHIKQDMQTLKNLNLQAKPTSNLTPEQLSGVGGIVPPAPQTNVTVEQPAQ